MRECRLLVAIGPESPAHRRPLQSPAVPGRPRLVAMAPKVAPNDVRVTQVWEYAFLDDSWSCGQDPNEGVLDFVKLSECQTEKVLCDHDGD